MAHPEEMYGGASAFPTDKLIGYFDLLHSQHKVKTLRQHRKKCKPRSLSWRSSESLGKNKFYAGEAMRKEYKVIPNEALKLSLKLQETP